ncbi:MAG: endonuclease/exonuclease/phosphatase family protein [Solirubrobacteraceae bacterium]
MSSGAVYVGRVVWRLLSWNLFHGRAVPPAGRELLREFTAALDSWEWDAALLQEVPPWWPAQLASALDADHRMVLTSRNSLLPVRRGIALRWPDLIKSNGGGANAILVRRSAGWIAEHRALRLGLRPERRWLHGVRVDGLWICNLHTQADPRQCELAAAAVRSWTSSLPIVLGGDFNVRSLALDGFDYAGGCGVDHVFVRGLEVAHEVAPLEHDGLSDHAPLLATVRRAGRAAP